MMKYWCDGLGKHDSLRALFFAECLEPDNKGVGMEINILDKKKIIL